MEEFNCKDLIREMHSLFEYHCESKGLYLKYEIDKDTPKKAFSDKDRIA